MNFVCLMDPLESVIMKKDTSFILMLGAYKRGHNIYFLPNGGIVRKDGQTNFNVESVIPQQNETQPFIRQDKITLSEDQVNALFIRTDPPFNDQYLMNTWLLDHVTDKVFVINNPTGIRTVNEKLWATQFTSLVPPTLVGRDTKTFNEFIAEQNDVIAKPTDGHGGKGVFRIKQGDVNTNVIFETLTEHFTKDIILQKYIPEAQDGDKRILLLNGEPLGAVLRVAGDNDHRNNFFAGGKPVATEITERDQVIIAELKPYLQDLGLYFVGIDIMGEYLVEVNVTSPTCLQEINTLNGQSLEDDVIVFIENSVEKLKSTSTIA